MEMYSVKAEEIKQKLLDGDVSHEVYIETYKLINELLEEIKGPDSFATWKDAAVSEKMKRIKLEKELRELKDSLAD